MKNVMKWMLTLLFATATLGAAQAQSKVEQDLDELRAWMQRRSGQADSTLRKEWPSVKQEFKSLTSGLNRNTQSLSEESRAEYNDIKQRYESWEERNESTAVDLEGKELERWERELTGTTNINRIKPAKMRDAYARLLEKTRGQRRNWSLRDWEYADFVLGELNSRKAEVLHQLSNGDKIKIAALQVEFASLKRSREAKDAYEHMIESKR
ncbi:hypothetical protein DXT99_19505 [Pontibacter diazotrophicus]|uniref:DUF349 domain-containing protein n=1 Tax=Pontibacter diazotrophicus TaxID=1400979 RepID=A0A3D8L8R9_9BACT|nr:hypothetical protein [Pontibacter diazotrophicus]RDV13382.1 hypothetical protein DXT99_19505 [Pontibacter diazotrophicus]